ncbi:MAG: Ldh family oxidoreductase [Acidimicrobiales bacterium]
MKTTVAAATEAAVALLRAAGMPTGPADRTAWALVTAEAWGRASHGLLRLPHYLRRFQAGGSDPHAQLTTVSDTDVTATFDGGNGLGHWQLWEAATTAVGRARRHGLAAVAVGNSGHCGALGLYVLPMLDADLVGLVFSNGPAVMPPWGGNRPVLSTSPLAAGIPTSPRPAIVDMATSAIARGKIAEAAGTGRALPEGWALDAGGSPTTDPQAALAGMLAPFGGAKGYALAFAIEALTGALVGPSLAGDVADPLSIASAGAPQRISHLALALDPGRFDVDGRGPGRMEELASRINAAGGRLPGANRALPEEIQPSDPLTVTDSLAEELAAMASERGVILPPPWAPSR